MGKEIFAVYYHSKWDYDNSNGNAIAYIPKEVTVHGVKQTTYTTYNNGKKYKINEHGIKYLESLNVWVPKPNNQDIEIILQIVKSEQRINLLQSNIRKMESLITQIHNATVG